MLSLWNHALRAPTIDPEITDNYANTLSPALGQIVRGVLFTAAAICLPTASQGSETVQYTYDSLGRLVRLSHSGAINQGATTTYEYDSADNRKNVTVSSSWTSVAYRTGDFNGDGRSDILWRDDIGNAPDWSAGTITDWLSSSTTAWIDNWGNGAAPMPTSWKVAAVGDSNGDGRSDILWRESGGTVATWLGTSNGGFASGWGSWISPSWKIVTFGDFNGDGRKDILFQADSGQVIDWLAQTGGSYVDNSATLNANVGLGWHVAGTGDFNGDGREDILWRNDNGQITDWLGTTTGGFADNSANVPSAPAGGWNAVAVGDFNGDGRADILWRRADGLMGQWMGTASGGFVDSGHGWSVPTNYRIDLVGDFNGDHRDDILWRTTAGTIVEWLSTSTGDFVGNSIADSSVSTEWNLEPRQ